MEQGELQISPFRDKCNKCNMALCQIVNLLLRHKDNLPIGVVYCVEGHIPILLHSVFYLEIIPKWDFVRKCVRACVYVCKYSCSSDCVRVTDSMSRR